LDDVERLIRFSIALLVGVGATFAGAVAAGAGAQGPSRWATALEAFALPFATLADRTGSVGTPLAYWLLVLAGFVLWSAIGYIASAEVLRAAG
jgi:phosphatidylglycerophosphate synthase